MSRFFNGGTAADSITFSLGSAPTTEGPITMAVLAHASSATAWTAWLMQGFNGTSGAWAMLTSGNVFYIENDFTAGGPALLTGWCWYVARMSATTATPRWSVHDLTAATAWSHTNGAGPVTAPGVTAAGILIGSNATANPLQTWRGRIAAAAAWNGDLTDVAVEAACTSQANDLAAASPAWGVLFNQGSTATPVTDFTGNGGNQTAIGGTAVDADEPPGWSYTITGPAQPLPRPVRTVLQAVNRANNY